MAKVIEYTGTREVLYSTAETNGVIVIVIASAISLLAELGLLGALIVARLRPSFNKTSDSLFLHSNVGTYFISLLVANSIAAIGSFMNIHWVSEKAVSAGGFCTAQGAIKNIGNVATALWTLVIAMHIFNTLFLRREIKRFVSIAVTVAVWCSVFTIDMFGPTILAKSRIGPYFGISGYWCWITSEYHAARIGLEYFWFFFSGSTSFVLYVLVFLRLRGNIYVPDGSRFPHLRWLPKSKAWKLQASRDAVDAHMTDVAKLMIWYPLAYTIVIIPIAINRFLENGGTQASFGYVMFADSLFMLSGFVNVVLFLMTRRYMPSPQILPTFNIPRKLPPSAFIIPPDSQIVEPYVVESAASDESFGTRDRDSRKWEDEKEANMDTTNHGYRQTSWGSTRTYSSTNSDGTLVDNPALQQHVEPLRSSRMPSLQPPVTSPNTARPSHLHTRQDSRESLHNPFRDHGSPASDASWGDDLDDETHQRDSAYTVSAYFVDVDLASAAPGHDRFPRRPQSLVPPIPAAPRIQATRDIPNRI